MATAARLFHACDGTGFADLIIDGHRETWPLRSKRLQGLLRQQYYERTWDAPSPAALNAASMRLRHRPSSMVRSARSRRTGLWGPRSLPAGQRRRSLYLEEQLARLPHQFSNVLAFRNSLASVTAMLNTNPHIE